MSGAVTIRRTPARRAAAHFVQAAFSLLGDDVARGEEVPFALDARGRPGGPALYEYRPLFGPYVADRLPALTGLADFRSAVEALAADAGVLAAARDTSGEADAATALRDTVLVPLVVGVAERCGRFDFDDDVFDALFERLLLAAASRRRTYTAFAPLVGLRSDVDGVDLGGVVLRRSDERRLRERWPDAERLLPERHGRDDDRLLGLELEAALAREGGEETPDAAVLMTRAVVALRLVCGGAVSAGPCLFERLDWQPRGVRALPAPALLAPPGEPAHLAAATVPTVRSVVARLGAARGRGGEATATAVARYATSATAATPVERIAGLLGSLEPLLDDGGAGAWAVAMRAAALVGTTAAERRATAALVREAAALARPGTRPSDRDLDALAASLDGVARTTLVAALELDGGAAELPAMLDDVLLGARPRPQVAAQVARSA